VREARACWLPDRDGVGSDGQRYRKARSSTAKNTIQVADYSYLSEYKVNHHTFGLDRCNNAYMILKFLMMLIVIK